MNHNARNESDLYRLAKTEEEHKKAVVELMKKGWVLCRWRRSSPHNWFLEHPRDPGEQITLSVFHFNLDQMVHLSDSEEKVIQHLGSDSGMPSLTKYVLKKSHEWICEPCAAGEEDSCERPDKCAKSVEKRNEAMEADYDRLKEEGRLPPLTKTKPPN